ncbi:MAG: PAS domain-containing protein [Anaerolineae bacterium]|nr:PAS domain-containing protein [Anaerolineae bacterium]
MYGLKKLLRARQITPLLREFSSLLGPQAFLALSDASGHVLASAQPVPEAISAVLSELPLDHATEVMIIPQGAAVPICIEGRPEGWLLAVGSLPPPEQTRPLLSALKHALEAIGQAGLERRAVADEALERYQELNLLYSVGEAIASCVHLNELLHLVLDRAVDSIQAQAGVVLLYDEKGTLQPAAALGLDGFLNVALDTALAHVRETVRAGKSSIVNECEVPFLSVPLRTSKRPVGAILLLGKTTGVKGDETFIAGDEKLLSALAWQAAIAIENVQLLDDMRRQRDEIASIKSYMDSVFASLTSGVITISTDNIITTFNQAAGRIFHVPPEQALHRPCFQVLPLLQRTSLPALLEDIYRQRIMQKELEVHAMLPGQKHAYLEIRLSRLRGHEDETLGAVIVVEDVTEKRRYERERRVLRHYLPEGLVDRLPYDTGTGLREERRLITIMFADLGGFTRFSESNPPERVVEVLNHYFTLAEAAVRFNMGIVDKYLGDAILALFNTPLLEVEDHAWRAVRTAWTLMESMREYHKYLPPDERLAISIGISTGIAVVGNIGTEERIEYTAIGDAVNLAKRLQENALPGQVLISQETWERVRNRVRVNPLPAILVKGRQNPVRIYELAGVEDVR